MFAVADGMGGHEGGEIASALAIESLRALLTPETPAPSAPTAPGSRRRLPEVEDRSNSHSHDPSDGTGPNPRPLTRAAVLDAIRQADRQIFEYSHKSTERGMGTTLCGLVDLPDDAPNTVLVFNVGDSRIYRQRGPDLVQLTHDHSVVQELIDAGQLDAGSAETHPERNVITRSLGAETPVDVDWWTVDALPGDQFLLCSDGLVREVPTDALRSILIDRAGQEPQSKVDRLIATALDGGGRDNVTVAVVEITRLTAETVHDDPSHPGDLVRDTNPRSAKPDTKPRTNNHHYRMPPVELEPQTVKLLAIFDQEPESTASSMVTVTSHEQPRPLASELRGPEPPEPELIDITHIPASPDGVQPPGWQSTENPAALGRTPNAVANQPLNP